MELRTSAIRPGPATTPVHVATAPRAKTSDDPPTSAAPRALVTTRPAPQVAHVSLVSWFDRNGDGKIDDTTWMEGGDAFLPVGTDVAVVLSRTPSTHPDKGPTPASTPAVTTQTAAVDAYRRYGDTQPVTTTTPGSPAGSTAT